MSQITANQPVECNVTAKVLSEHVIAPQIVILGNGDTFNLPAIDGTDVSQTVKVVYLGDGGEGNEATINADGSNTNNNSITDLIVSSVGFAASGSITLDTFGSSFNFIALSSSQYTIPCHSQMSRNLLKILDNINTITYNSNALIREY